MSRFDDWREFAPAPKKPPPAHGIKMKKVGTTWWGQRWIEALEQVLGGDAKRLARGRSYARAGRTHDLVVKNGKVSARVTGSRATPYEITIRVAQLPEPIWKKAILGMAAQAQFTAELLAGQMPQAIDEVFRAAGASLFPSERRQLETSCSCPDWGDPCKHVAATHYVLGEALERDPFLLFELRGRTQAQALDALRLARGGEVSRPAQQRRGAKAQLDAGGGEPPEVPRVAFGKVSARDYDKPRAALPALQFSFEAPQLHAAVLRQLGAPSAWSAADSPAQELAPLVRAAAEAARRIALSETSFGPDPEAAQSEPGAPPKRRARTSATPQKAAVPSKKKRRR